MRIVEMDPDEERTAWVLAQPGESVGHHYTPASPGGTVMVLSRSGHVKAGIVGVKSPVKADAESLARVENNGANEGRCVISVGLQNCGRIRQVFQKRHLEIRYLVELRIRTGEDGGMRRHSEGDLGVRMGENHGLAGQFIQIRRQPAVRSQKTHTVGARRVQCDQDNIGRYGGGYSRPGQRSGRQREHAQRDAPPVMNQGHGSQFIIRYFGDISEILGIFRGFF